MLIFISGGVRSGKSALGERLVTLHARGRKVYLATSEAYDEEMVERIGKHRADRAGKGFATIEKSRDIGSVAPLFNMGDAVLLDCLGTLAANEMFGGGVEVQPSTASVESLTDRVFDDIMSISHRVGTLIVISNEIFSDGIAYERDTMNYIRLLGKLHCRLADAADMAIECAYGAVTVHKGNNQ